MDGVWVVIHDRNLLRITGVNKDVTQMPFEEIQSLDAAYNFLIQAVTIYIGT